VGPHRGNHADDYATFTDAPTSTSCSAGGAGTPERRSDVHRHFADSLRYACQVGATFWEELGAGEADLPGPQPESLFAPAQIAKRSEEWGSADVDARIGRSLAEFLDTAPQWLTV